MSRFLFFVVFIKYMNYSVWSTYFIFFYFLFFYFINKHTNTDISMKKVSIRKPKKYRRFIKVSKGIKTEKKGEPQ